MISVTDRREGKRPVDATHGLVFGNDQARQRLGKEASGGLGVKHLAKTANASFTTVGKSTMVGITAAFSPE